MIDCEVIINRRKELWDEHKSIDKDREYIDSVAQFILENEDIRIEIQEYPEKLIEMCFVIVDKDKQTVPFFLNGVQHDFIRRLNKAKAQYKAGKRLFLRFLILKGRQQGFTTFITGYQLACIVTRKNFEGFTVADEDGNTNAIFENKAKFCYNRLPAALKPSERFNNRKQLIFEKINSSWEIKTATKQMGRSRTINFFHGSEGAFWKIQISDAQAALGESLTKDAIQIIESTGNGFNEYKDLWDSDTWENCFYEWWLTEEYRHNFESEEIESDFKSQVDTSEKWIYERCRWLKRAVQLDWNQVYWYYIKYVGYINKELIKQEYPCSDLEAFLASGLCIFDKDVIVTRMENLKRIYNEHPPKRGYFRFEWNDPKTMDFIKDDTITWVDNKDGFITMYEDPKELYPYVLGGDTKGEGRDKYAGTVINNITGKRCVSLHMQSNNSKPYTHQMYCLGKQYNDALIGIEMNFNTAPIEELDRLNYPRQYVRVKHDNFKKETESKYGWKTDGNTRPLIIDKEIDLIDNNIDLFVDLAFLGECLTFVYDKNNRPDAESGKNDDLLISDMIANEIRSQQQFTLFDQIIERKPRGFPFNQSDDDEGGGLGW